LVAKAGLTVAIQRRVQVRQHAFHALLALSITASCSALKSEGAFVDHDEASDFEEGGSDERSDGLSASFSRNLVMSDDFFRATHAVDADGLQEFFENSPYDNRSWLADARVNGRRAADAIVDASVAHGINPLVMVGRMQVEKGLVSKTVNPGGNRVDFAFGCGCHDGSSCLEIFRGLDKQIECSAETLSRWFIASEDGTGEWRVGHSERTLDPLTVTPQNHATASLYSYTPWVLQGSGGNWLVWNITRKFEQHAKAIGILGGDPEAPIAARWTRLSDGSYDLEAEADADVDKIRYFVDGIVIGEATRSSGSHFPAHRVFNHQGPDRPFEVRGYNALGSWVAMGNGRLDVTDREAVFIRQVDVGEYDIGLERADTDVGAIEVFINDVRHTSLSGQALTLRTAIAEPGASTFEVKLFDHSGTPLRSYIRKVVVR
jgi:hypothetical protein